MNIQQCLRRAIYPQCPGDKSAELKVGSTKHGRSLKAQNTGFHSLKAQVLVLVLRAMSVPLLRMVGSLKQKRPMTETETSQLSQNKPLSAKLPLPGMWLQ